MGLDISVYEKIELAEAITYEQLKALGHEHSLYDQDDHFHVSVVHEEYREKTPSPEGFYKISGKRHGFRAGSYSGYNAWRRWLASVVGTTDKAVWDGHVPPAFGELIHFSDCEGTLKSEVCAKLAKDFDDWRVRAALGSKPVCEACGSTMKHLPAEKDHGEHFGCDNCGAMFDPSTIVDFQKLIEDSKSLHDDHAWNFSLYEEWREAFKLAANGGAVDFH